eukprot:1194694-Prorocentrum_minimum.AAC.2
MSRSPPGSRRAGGLVLRAYRRRVERGSPIIVKHLGHQRLQLRMLPQAGRVPQRTEASLPAVRGGEQADDRRAGEDRREGGGLGEGPEAVVVV